METILQKQSLQVEGESLVSSFTKIWEKVCVLFWFVLCLLLFVALGPFSAPVALVALYKTAMEDDGTSFPEIASQP